MLLEVNHYAVGKSKKLICEVLKAEIIAKIILFYMYAEFHIIYFQMIFYTVHY